MPKYFRIGCSPIETSIKHVSTTWRYLLLHPADTIFLTSPSARVVHCVGTYTRSPRAYAPAVTSPAHRVAWRWHEKCCSGDGLRQPGHRGDSRYLSDSKLTGSRKCVNFILPAISSPMQSVNSWFINKVNPNMSSCSIETERFFRGLVCTLYRNWTLFVSFYSSAPCNLAKGAQPYYCVQFMTPTTLH